MNQKKIGAFIRERRKEKKLTQEELAEKLRVSNRTISKWENGNSIPDYSIINNLCEELDVSINELLSGEKIKGENYQKMFEANVLKTIKYNNKKMLISYVRIVIVFIILLVLCLYFGYKSMLFKQLRIDDYKMFKDMVPPTKYIKDDIKLDVEPNNKVTYNDYYDIEFYLDPSYELTTDLNEGAELFLDTYIKKENDEVVGRYQIEAYSGPMMYDSDSDAQISYETSLRLQKKYGIYNIVDYFEYYYNMKPVNYLSSIDEIYMYASTCGRFLNAAEASETHGIKGDLYGLYSIDLLPEENPNEKHSYYTNVYLYNLERNARLTASIYVDNVTLDEFKEEVDNFIRSVRF